MKAAYAKLVGTLCAVALVVPAVIAQGLQTLHITVSIADAAQHQEIRKRTEQPRNRVPGGRETGPPDTQRPAVKATTHRAGVHHPRFHAGGQHLPLARREHQEFRPDLAEAS